MYSVSKIRKQYDTYILSDQESGARMEVVPERGGIISQWEIGGTKLLYLDAERFTNPSLSVRGGIPILFPICGNVAENRYQVEGHDYPLQQHGFAREMAWSVSDHVVGRDGEDGAMIQLSLESTEETRRKYPFDFQLQFTYRLKGDGVTLEQRFINRSDRPMPFSTGQHGYFQTGGSVQSKSQLQLEIPGTHYYDNIAKTIRAYRDDFDWSASEIDAAFRPISDHVASVKDPAGRVRITMTMDKAYTTIVFWTVEGKEFYCLEPWSAPRNALNTGADLIVLAPGASQTLTVKYAAQVGPYSEKTYGL